MQPGALRALEFDRIVEAVRELRADADGRRAPGAARSRRPSRRRWPQLLAATTETARFLAADGAFPLRAPSDLAADPRLRWPSRAARSKPLRLLALAAFLDSVDETRHGHPPRAAAPSRCSTRRRARRRLVRARDRGGPRARSTRPARSSTTRARSCRRSAIGCASSARGCAARSSRTCAARTRRSTCRSRSSPSATAATCWSSRPSIAAAIPGHRARRSASGASLFLEPLSTVEINNDIVALEEQEAEEVRRILLALTDAFRARGRRSAADDRGGDRARRAAGAGAVLASRSTAIEPALVDRRRVRAAQRGIRCSSRRASIRDDAGAPVTPIRWTSRRADRALLITGPNTGGKTVALKTAGLLALMAQAGPAHPAADGSRVPVFRSVFADIGDEQSIDASLSTFSAHITNIASMDRGAGAAGAGAARRGRRGHRSDRRRRARRRRSSITSGARGAMVVATTHYDALKTYASTTDGVDDARRSASTRRRSRRPTG